MIEGRTGASPLLLDAIGFARRTRSPLLGALLGIRGATPGLGLAAAYETPPGPTEIGVLADLALGVPARAQHGRDHRLVTSSMDVALSTPSRSTAQLQIVADPITTGGSTRGNTIFVVGQVRDAAREGPPIGTCGAAYNARDGGMSMLPWETGERAGPSDRVVDDELTPEERVVLDILTRSPRPPGTALMDAALEQTGEHCSLHPLPVMMNRAGALQGGVVFGFAVTAALQHAGVEPADTPFASHVDFVGPATLDAGPVEAATSVLRDGRRQRLARVDLRQDGALVAAATVRHPLTTG